MHRRVGALAVAALFAFAACSAENPGPRNVLLVTLDTTRYNALGCYGNPKNPTPNLDRIAAEGVVFERARTVTPLTLPAYASMLTGLYPIRHTLRGNGVHPLPSAAQTIAELARAQGVQTAAFVASVVLDPVYGLDQGFETYAAVPREAVATPHEGAELRAPVVVGRARQWLDARDRAKPFFAWIHLFDAHTPYAPPAELAQESGYLGEVAFMDRALGELFDALRSDGTLDRTLLIVVADHGEGLKQHGEPTHGWFCYDGTLRVPMIVRFPGLHRRGERSLELASVVDVFPTALEGLGIAPPEGIDGRSLFRQTVAEERGLYFESYFGFTSFGWSPLAGWIDSRGKYIHSSAPEFYEVDRDKPEARNVAGERAELVAAARGEIERLASLPALARDAEPELDANAREALRKLGYVDVGQERGALPHPLAPGNLPAPSSRAEELALFHKALALEDSGQREPAAEAWRELVERYPSNTLGRSFRAADLVQLGRWSEARVVLDELANLGRLTASDFNNLGWCHEQAGEKAAALAAYRRALDLDSGEPFARANLDRLSKP